MGSANTINIGSIINEHIIISLKLVLILLCSSDIFFALAATSGSITMFIEPIIVEGIVIIGIHIPNIMPISSNDSVLL